MHLEARARSCLEEKGRGPLGIHSLWIGEMEPDQKNRCR